MSSTSLFDDIPSSSSSSKRSERLSPPSPSPKKQRTLIPSSQDGDLDRVHRDLDQVALSIKKVEQEIDELNVQLHTIDAQLIIATDPETIAYLRIKEAQLRKKEEQLRNEKARHLEEKALLLQQRTKLSELSEPSTPQPLLPRPEAASSPSRLYRYFAPHAELSDFISPLLAEPLNSFSALPVPRMKLDEIFSINVSQSDPTLRIFHRKCYSDLFIKLTQIDYRWLTKSIITGTPGIGKSHSFFCFLRLLLLQRNADGEFTRRIIGYERDYLKVFSFYELSEDGTQIFAYKVNLSTHPQYTDALRSTLCTTDIVFRDCEQWEGPGFSHLFLNCHELLLSSPRRNGFSRYLKYVRSMVQFVLPPFNLDEMVQFGQLMEYEPQHIHDARILYHIFGGVPRYCYELAYDLQTWRRFVMLFLDTHTEPLLKLNDTRFAVLHMIREHDRNESFPHRLLFLLPDRNLQFVRFAFPSRFIEELITVAHTLEEKTTALRFLSNAEVGKIYWRIFEHGCVQILTSPLSPLPLKRARWLDQAGRKILRWESIEASFELPHCNNVLYLEELPSTLAGDTLLVPLKSNNPTWDALSTSALFNFTVAPIHDFNRAGLTVAQDLLGNEQLPPFYWMVPQTTFDTGRFKITTTADYVFQLTHYLIPRPDPSPAVIRDICRKEILARFRLALESNSAISAALAEDPPMSNELKMVIEQAIRPIYEEEDEEGLPSSSSCY